MTLEQLYREGKKRLAAAGIESPAFDALCLFQKCFGLDRLGLAVHGGEPAKEEAARQFLDWAAQRGAGRPLQYLLGEWEFMGRLFFVGEGVLIPREETGLLAEEGIRFAKQFPAPDVLELCAGSGAVCITVQKQVPAAQVTAVELSTAAAGYFARNIRRHQARVTMVQADVLTPPSSEIKPQQVILANPPYVTTQEMKELPREVQQEPEMALWGGEDGLLFYRAILTHWLPLLVPGGLLAVECGKGQGERVALMLEQAGLDHVEIKQDFNRIGRVVRGQRELPGC